MATFGELLTRLTICSLCILTTVFVISVISRFGFEGWIWVVIASAPGLCIRFTLSKYLPCIYKSTKKKQGGRTGLMVRASDSGSGDPGSILGRVGVFVSLSKRHLLPKKYW